MMVADEMVLVRVSSVPVATLGLLLGRDFLDAVAGVLDFAERTLLCRAFNSKRAAVKQLSAGHLALPLIPEVWPDLCSPRWRKLGPDNVIETRLDCKAWARQLMKTPSRAAASSVSGGDSHSHNMTEASLALGRRVFEYNSVLLTSAQKMCVETPVVKAPAASSVTVRSKDGGVRRGTSTLFRSWFGSPRRLRRRHGARALLSHMAQDGDPKPGPVDVGKRRPSSCLGQAARLALLAVSVALGYFGGFVEGVWTASALSSMTWFRNRFGLRFSFLEDPFLQGMLAVTSTKGHSARVRAAMVKEAQQEAAKEADRMQVARSLIGPRGGLPTLKADLLRLAALLEVKVSERDKVDDLKAKLRPMVALLKNETSSSKPAPLSSSGSMPSSSTPFAKVLPTSSPMPSPPLMSRLQAHGSEAEVVSMSVFTSYMEQMDHKYQDMLQQATSQQQAMLNQVLHHMMQMQAAQTQDADTLMEGDEGWSTVTQPNDDTPVDPRREQLGCLEKPL
ncbi:agaA [Symbiodinium sp. CCMP2456]|nr:agaA [Symbiodinium sp. CCMP2456]